MGMENGAPVEGDIALVEEYQKKGGGSTFTHGRDNKISNYLMTLQGLMVDLVNMEKK